MHIQYLEYIKKLLRLHAANIIKRSVVFYVFSMNETEEVKNVLPISYIHTVYVLDANIHIS